MNSEIKYRADIDGLRAIAVLMVVIYHAFPAKLSGGFTGVDVFFVISGFLISTILFREGMENRFSFKMFYIKRINRIFPALLIVLIASLFFGYLSLFIEELQSLSKHIAGGAGFVNNFLLWKESGYFDSSSDLKPLLHLWSLAIEEQYYVVWPVIIYFFLKNKINLLWVIVSFIVASFLWNMISIRHHIVSAFYLLPARFWELMLGGYLAHVTLNEKRFFVSSKINEETIANIKSFLGIFLIAASAIFIKKENIYPGYLALLPTFGTVLLISSGNKAWFNRNVLSHKFLVSIGLISYPLYLWHWPILAFLRIVNNGEIPEPTRLLRIGAIILSIILSWLTYKFIETPIRHRNKSSILALGLFGLMLVIGCMGFITYKFPPKRSNFTISAIEAKTAHFRNAAVTIPVENCPEGISKTIQNCRLAIPSKAPTVAIIGDSHVNAFYTGLAESFKAKGENLLNLGHPGCLPFFDVESAQVGAEESCLANMNYALRFAMESNSIHTIILGSRGPFYMTGKGFNEPEIDHYIKYPKNAAIKDYAEIFRASLIDTMTQLTQTKKKIIYLLDIPELGFNPALCLGSRSFLAMAKQKIPCVVEQGIVSKRNKQYVEIVTSSLKAFPSVKIFDQSKFLCDGKNCRVIIDNKFMYRDDDHLSPEGAAYLSEKFMEELY